MRGSKEVIYWDASVFLSLLKNETYRPNHEFDGVLDCVDRVEAGKVLLVTSDFTVSAEVLKADMTDDARRMFADLFKRRNVQVLPYQPRVNEIVNEIREYYQVQNQRDNQGNVGSMDAFHLATAIYYEQVDALYTFDDGKNRKTRSLLSLTGNVAGYPLLICKPPVGQMRLTLDADATE